MLGILFPMGALHPALCQTEHRPWPLPERPWVMQQVWQNLLFLHWPLAPDALRGRIPAGLELDTWGGEAWLGVVPFDMKSVTLRGCPAPPAICDFPELNLRTYVIRDGKPGVWFFSLDITQALGVWVARTFFHLPYFKARMAVEEGVTGVRYASACGERILGETDSHEIVTSPRLRSADRGSRIPACLLDWSKKQAALSH